MCRIHIISISIWTRFQVWNKICSNFSFLFVTIEIRSYRDASRLKLESAVKSFFSIINRGKLLHSAMNSLHNFDRSLDKFLAWLSEAESSMEGLEAEADRLGGRRDQGALRRPQHQLKVSPYFCLYKNSRILLFRVFIP